MPKFYQDGQSTTGLGANLGAIAPSEPPQAPKQPDVPVQQVAQEAAVQAVDQSAYEPNDAYRPVGMAPVSNAEKLAMKQAQSAQEDILKRLDEKSEALKGMEKPGEPPTPPHLQLIPDFKPFERSGTDWAKYAALVVGLTTLFGHAAGVRGGLAAFRGAMEGINKGEEQRAQQNFENFKLHMAKVREENAGILREYDMARGKYKDDLEKQHQELLLIGAKYDVPLLRAQTIRDSAWKTVDAFEKMRFGMAKLEEMNQSHTRMYENQRLRMNTQQGKAGNGPEVAAARDIVSRLGPKELRQAFLDRHNAKAGIPPRNVQNMNSLNSALKWIRAGDPNGQEMQRWAAAAEQQALKGPVQSAIPWDARANPFKRSAQNTQVPDMRAGIRFQDIPAGQRFIDPEGNTRIKPASSAAQATGPSAAGG